MKKIVCIFTLCMCMLNCFGQSKFSINPAIEYGVIGSIDGKFFDFNDKIEQYSATISIGKRYNNCHYIGLGIGYQAAGLREHTLYESVPVYVEYINTGTKSEINGYLSGSIGTEFPMENNVKSPLNIQLGCGLVFGKHFAVGPALKISTINVEDFTGTILIKMNYIL